jgi:hypothetical protein
MRKLKQGIGVVVCGVALFAAGVAPADNPGHGNGTSSTSTSTAAGPDTASTTATLPSQAKGYGFYCQNQSKVHVAGRKGTPFSQCVTAMAHLAHGQTSSPKTACATMSHEPDGQGGSPFSRCVSAGAKLLKNNH